MNSSRQARDLANYLAPMLDGAQGVNGRPGSQDDPAQHQKGIISTGPDVEAALQKAEGLGGTRRMGPERAPTGLVVGHFTDPEGNLIGVAGAA